MLLQGFQNTITNLDPTRLATNDFPQTIFPKCDEHVIFYINEYIVIYVILLLKNTLFVILGIPLLLRTYTNIFIYIIIYVVKYLRKK